VKALNYDPNKYSVLRSISYVEYQKGNKKQACDFFEKSKNIAAKESIKDTWSQDFFG
tara:strand:+ start:738 stop:908 length:171 start_codon:yes stop_codon:yes gene_type:complete